MRVTAGAEPRARREGYLTDTEGDDVEDECAGGARDILSHGRLFGGCRWLLHHHGVGRGKPGSWELGGEIVAIVGAMSY